MAVPDCLLAQSPLPDPALVPKLLFEQPLLLSGVFILIGVAAFFVLNTQGKVKKALVIGGAGLLLAVVVQVVAAGVETAREKIMAATTPLVKVTAAADTVRLGPMLDPGVKLTNEKGFLGSELPQGEPWDKARILEKVSDQFNKWKIMECEVLEVQGVIDLPGQGRTQVRVRVVPDVYDIPITTVWRIDWKEDSKGRWVVTGIEPIDLGLPNRLR